MRQRHFGKTAAVGSGSVYTDEEISGGLPLSNPSGRLTSVLKNTLFPYCRYHPDKMLKAE